METIQDSVFSCRLESNKILSDLLICLIEKERKDQLCYFEVTSDSLTLTVSSKSKSTQARASLQEDIFEEFSCENDIINFTVNLSTLLSCLNLHGQTSEIVTSSIYYSSEEAIFKLTLEESGILSVCEMNTIDITDEDNPGLFDAFQSKMSDTKTIQIEVLKLDSLTGAALTGGNNSNITEGMKFLTSGTFCTCEIQLPRTCDAFVSYRCESACVWSYPSHVVVLGMKALQFANETFIRINEDGIMCIQHQVPTVNGKTTYIDFLMLPCENATID